MTDSVQPVPAEQVRPVRVEQHPAHLDRGDDQRERGADREPAEDTRPLPFERVAHRVFVLAGVGHAQVVARAIHRGAQRIHRDAGRDLDAGLFRREVDRRAGHALDARQRTLDTTHAGGARHAADVEAQVLERGHAIGRLWLTHFSRHVVGLWL